MRIHTACRAEYSQKCTPHPRGPVCGRREASRSPVGRGLAHCLAGPWPCGRHLMLWKTPVFAADSAVNDRPGAGRADCVSALVMKKPSRPYRTARQSKSLDLGHPLFVNLSLEHAVEGAPGELGAFDAGGHVRDVLELGGFVQVFQVLLGELLAADHGEEELC